MVEHLSKAAAYARKYRSRPGVLERERTLSNKRRRTPEYRAKRNAYLAERRSKLDTFKEQPCADCGIQYPTYVMDWHHRDAKNKEITISSQMQLSWTRLLLEIDKCDLLCANCHRIRTHG